MLGLQNSRNLYLTALGLKPASEFTLGEDSAIRPGTQSDVKLLEETARQELNHFGIKHYVFSHTIESKPVMKDGMKSSATKYFWHVHVNLGRDQESLNKLLSAKNPYDLGIAFGFPVEAVRAYTNPDPKKQSRAWKINMQLCDARKEGLQIPEWYSFSDHVPSTMDLVHGKVCKGSEKLGMEYMDALRINAPNVYNLSLAEERAPVRYYQKKSGEPTFKWKKDYKR